MSPAAATRAPLPPTLAREKLTREATVIVAVLVVSTFTVILNEMLMVIALPRVMTDLDVTASTGQWLTTAYMLTMAVVIPATGFLTERYSMRTVFTLAMLLFAAGTLVAVLAPGFDMLLVARIIQAVGTAIVLPLSYTAVSTLVPETRRGSVLALVTVATAAAPSIGPVVAGAILSRLDWHWLFIAILPIAIGSLVLGNIMIRVPSTPRKVGLDALSVILSAVGFASLVYGLASFGEGAADAVVSPWASLAVGAAVVTAFVARQIHLQKSDRAQLDLRPFKIRTFSVSVVTMLCFMTAAFGMMTLMPVMLQTSYGLSPVEAGLFIMPGGITIAVVSALVGRMYDRVGPRPLIIAGALIIAVGQFHLSTLAPETPIWRLLGAFLFIVVGQALMWSPLFAASLGVLSPHLLPHGSAIVNTLQQLVGAAGIAIAFSVMGTASAGYIQAGEPAAAAMAHGAQWTYFVCSGFGLAALVAALFLPRKVAATSVPVAAH
jgi:DHA2 family lincomycin resistance protein-like MFS transporter